VIVKIRAGQQAKQTAAFIASRELGGFRPFI